MLRTILTHGIIAGLVVVVPMFTGIAMTKHGGWMSSMAFGYAMMLLAFSLIFVGVKRFRDRALGGVIRFGPALLIGLGISAVAGLVYVVCWEITLMATHYAFAGEYAQAAIASAKAKGASAAELAKVTAQMEAFKAQYANPLYRCPMTFIEIFPVGVAVSLIAAALLRNSRFLPARG